MKLYKEEKRVAIIGGGAAGLIASYLLAEKGVKVELFERNKTLGKKFILAGKSGLNLSYNEPLTEFTQKYNQSEEFFSRIFAQFPPTYFLKLFEKLGIETYTGSSLKMFPKEKTAKEIVEIFYRKLKSNKVKIFTEHQWLGFSGENKLIFINKGKEKVLSFSAILLALGGVSYPFTGSKGEWKEILEKENIKVENFKPANSGFMVKWSSYFSEKYKFTPIKNIKLKFNGKCQKGEILITDYGVEGGLIYTFGREIREEIYCKNEAVVFLDLKPDYSFQKVKEIIEQRNKKESFSNFLRKRLKLQGISLALIKEILGSEVFNSSEKLTFAIKKLPVSFIEARPIEEAISTAGGINLDELTPNLMLKKREGVFAVGEMLNWEAPTGGYLLQGSFATAAFATAGIIKYLTEE